MYKKHFIRKNRTKKTKPKHKHKNSKRFKLFNIGRSRKNSQALDRRLRKRFSRKLKRSKAGKVIGTGTYGCVFKPPLICQKKSKNDPKYAVSKLLTKKNLDEEVKQTDEIKKILDKKPIQYNEFCILPSSADSCLIDLKDPENIKELNAGVKDPNRLVNCKDIYNNLHNVKYWESQRKRAPNDSIDHFESLNMIDGGVDLEIYLENTVQLKLEINDPKETLESDLDSLYLLLKNELVLEEYALLCCVNPIRKGSLVKLKLNIKGQMYDKKKELFKRLNKDMKIGIEETMQSEINPNITLQNISLTDKPKEPLDEETFANLNEAMIGLLRDGIKKLNDENIYHCDLKTLNVTFNVNDNKLRLIDWGLSYIDDPRIDTNWQLVRKKFKLGGLLYYGLAFGSLFITEKLGKTEDLRGNKTNKIGVKNVVTNKVEEHDWKDFDPSNIYRKKVIMNGNSMYKYINYDFLLGLRSFVDKAYKKFSVTNVIIDNIKKIKTECETDGLGDNKKILGYFRTVFLKNSDVFAFLLMYIKIYDYLPNTESWAITIRNNITRLIFKYIVTPEYATTPYDIGKIIDDLNNLTRTIDLTFPDQNNFLKEEKVGALTRQYSKIDRTIERSKKITRKKDCFGLPLNKIKSNQQVCYICREEDNVTRELQMGNRHQCRLCRNVVCNNHSTYLSLHKTRNLARLQPGSTKTYINKLDKCKNIYPRTKIRICTRPELCLAHSQSSHRVKENLYGKKIMTRIA
jgi:hypothetical protein